jgi:hypothetical protein
MTVVISAKVGEGLVYGADSMMAISIHDNTKNQDMVLNTFENARKLTQLKDYPIGILTWGLGAIGKRNIGSLVDEFGNSLRSCSDNKDYSVKKIAKNFFKFITDRYDNDQVINQTKSILGILIGGFSCGEFFPEQFKFELPIDKNIIDIRPNESDGNPNFGINWFGLVDGIVRFHWGYDDRLRFELQEILKSSKDLDLKAIDDIFLKHQYPADFGSMPLQDAIDYVNYLINLVIGRFRFYNGVPLCGGEIDIAIITYKGFEWIKTKKWKVK